MMLEKRLKASFDPYFEAPLEAWKQFASLCDLVRFKKQEIIKPFGQAERYGYFILQGSGGVFLWKENNYVCLDLMFEDWSGKRMWWIAGAGLGMDAPAFYDIKDASERKFYFGYAAVGSAGFEIWRKKRFSLDLQGRVHYGQIKLPEGKSKGLTLGLLLGFNFS